MATSMAALSRRLSRSLLSNPKTSHHCHKPFCTTIHQTSQQTSEAEDSDASSSDSDSAIPHSSSSNNSNQRRSLYDRPLEGGLDAGIYKAILVGQVGQKPVQKTLKNGMRLTMFAVGTGGIRNNRRPFDNENPNEYANRCAVQWHRVCIYPERLGSIAMKNALPGSILYMEGNLETKIFTDPITGLVRRIREIAIRQNGRIVFLGKEGNAQQPTQAELKGVGQY
ncbi:single-stranded DNA-binding protein, mitochondrial [Ziziphus jujuba]|uniref:Single-stranded DNA-binding protein, mitochondrial n=1 Tax=Ziziphus jujuba TaxID=326968 RepID=A0A6P4ABL7_ZIZJJ|nr:single-stranded DNA-binding protein, mitochondrial [Ziziphus jujuba]